MKKSNLRPSKGRPKLPADERKSIMVPVKFDIDQYQVMMDKTLMAGLNRSEYIRQSALHCKVVERLTPRDVKAIRDLQGIAENLNHTAKFVGAILKDGALRGTDYPYIQRDNSVQGFCSFTDKNLS